MLEAYQAPQEAIVARIRIPFCFSEELIKNQLGVRHQSGATGQQPPLAQARTGNRYQARLCGNLTSIQIYQTFAHELLARKASKLVYCFVIV